MQHLNETLFGCGIACSALGKPTKSGNYLIDLLLANVCKQNVTSSPMKLSAWPKISPAAWSSRHRRKSTCGIQNRAYVDKYLKGVSSVSTENRLKVLRLIENLCLGTAAVGYRTESMHGAGSPQAQRILIARQGNLEMKKELAKKIAHIEE